MSFPVSVHLTVTPLCVSGYGCPSPEKKLGEGSRGMLNRGAFIADLRSRGSLVAAQSGPGLSPGFPWAQLGQSRAGSGAPRAPGGGLSCRRRRGPSTPPSVPENMAAAPGRALLRAGTERLVRGGVWELLRPRLEGGTSGSERDFSLSHSRVRAGCAFWGSLTGAR